MLQFQKEIAESEVKMNRWTLALIGQIVGIIFFTSSNEFNGTRNINDVALIVGFGLPYALIGFVLGYVVEKYKK